MWNTLKRLRILGFVLVAAGLAVAGIGLGYGLPTANAGLDSAQAMYEAQGVTLSYNDEGQLVDRGTPEGAEKIMALLVEDFAYPVDRANFDPDDPLVNTRDELMFQYATITYHVLHGLRTVTLTESDVPITYRGVTYSEPGEISIEVGKYYAQFDRTNPIERQLRDAWSPQALALVSMLAGGHANQAAGELALYLSLGMAGIGGLFALAGAGLAWATMAHPAPAHAGARRSVPNAAGPVVRRPVRQDTAVVPAPRRL
jgi:hypothetical protein